MIPVNMSKAGKETSAPGECVRFKKDVFGRVAVGAIPPWLPCIQRTGTGICPYKAEYPLVVVFGNKGLKKLI